MTTFDEVEIDETLKPLNCSTYERERKTRKGKDGDWEWKEMRRARAASLRKALDEWEEEGAKKIHIKVKRGKPDGVTRSKGAAEGKEEKGGRKKRGRKTEQGRKRGARREFARFIPPPVFKPRPDVFPSPASLSALRFLLNRWYRTLSASRNPAV